MFLPTPHAFPPPPSSPPPSLPLSGSDVNAYNVLQCFRNSPRNCVRFKGATGTVAFNASTGERAASAQIPQYSFYNLIGYTWQVSE